VGEVSEICGTPAYIAPEALAEGRKNPEMQVKFQPSIDLFAYAVLLWELAMRKSPWEEYGEEGGQQVLDAMYSDPAKRLLITSFLLPRCYEQIIKRCWDVASSQRPPAATVANMWAERATVAALEEFDQDDAMVKEFFKQQLSAPGLTSQA